jgi:hypothetical protein
VGNARARRRSPLRGDRRPEGRARGPSARRVRARSQDGRTAVAPRAADGRRPDGRIRFVAHGGGRHAGRRGRRRHGAGIPLDA